jgi:hypothetical protein
LDFHQLAQELCDRFLAADRDHLVSGRTFEVNGVPAAMRWNAHDRPEHFTLVMDFGAPMAAAQEVFANLLKRNFALIGNDAGMLALDPDSQHVVYARSFELARVHALDVVDALMRAVEEAGSWRFQLRH